MHVASADARFADVPLMDIITGSSRYSIDWTKVCEGTEHTADETKIKITAMWKEKRIKQLIKTKEIIESQQKTLEADRKLSIGLIAKADVRTTDSMETNKVDGFATKNPVLVLQLFALLGDKASPKV